MHSDTNGSSTILKIIVVIAIALVLAFFVFGNNGNGNQNDDPGNVIKISTVEELQNISENGQYSLANDISLIGIEWSEIQYFNGTINGNGYSIIGLNLNGTSPDSYHGMIAELGPDGTISNLRLEQVNIHSTNAGALIGKSSGTIENVTVSGNVGHPTGSQIGGIVGYQLQGAINNCTNESNVNGSNCVGGIVGYSNGTLKSCFNNGTVTSTANSLGGIVGKLCQYGQDPGTISDCINQGIVESTGNYVGGIIGDGTNSGDISNCTNQGSVKSTGTCIGGIVGYWNSNRLLSGTNNGNVEGNESVGGIVGYAERLNIRISAQNCNVIQSSIVGKNNVGGIAGYSESTIIQNCNVDENSIISGNNSVGGIVGRSSFGEVVNCTSYGQITSTFQSSTNESIGGIVGYFYGQDHEVSNCKNYGSINVSGNRVGGVIGECRTYPMFDTFVNYCENYGTVTSSGNYVGGIVGLSDSRTQVSNCLNEGTISGINNVHGIGGGKVSSSVNYVEVISAET